MIVVAIVGVLAALGIYAVTQFTALSRSAEAKQTVGAITRAALAAFERKQVGAELSSPGASSSGKSGGTLCNTAASWVPADISLMRAKKYQPNTAAGQDFNTTDSIAGWKCLKFGISQPISYAYYYQRYVNALPTAEWGPACTGDNFYAQAYGDTDGNYVPAKYARCGMVVDSRIKLSTEINVVGD